MKRVSYILAKTTNPRNIPTTKPRPLTAKATTAFSSPFDFATAPKIKPAGPNTIGKNKKAITPQMIPTVEKVLPGLDGVGAENRGGGVG